MQIVQLPRFIKKECSKKSRKSEMSLNNGLLILVYDNQVENFSVEMIRYCTDCKEQLSRAVHSRK